MTTLTDSKMARAINCTECNLYLGEVRDAKLRLNISFLCEGCETSRKALKMKEGADKYGTRSGFNGLFDDTFSEIFGAGKFKR